MSFPENENGAALVVGGTAGLGWGIARELCRRGHSLVITGRSAERTRALAAELGDGTEGRAADLTKPESLAADLAGLGPISRLCLVASVAAENRVRSFDLTTAVQLVTAKLIGYAEVIHVLLPSLTSDCSVLLVGGHARKQPYDGSTSVTTVNGGVASLVRSLAVELAPIRVNGLHPGPIGDSSFWQTADAAVFAAVAARTLTGKLPTTSAIVEAAVFLLENESVSGVNLDVDSGALLAP